MPLLDGDQIENGSIPLNKLASTVPPATRNLTAGAGLVGGGDLSADRTFDVGANADGSIVVGANDVGVGVLATDAQHGNRGGGALHTDVVPAGASGFMTGVDKTKLDGIEASAINTQAGAGMTRTGSTLNVIGNADGSIVANADDVQVGVLASDAQHGSRGGGTQHALAIAAGASGFLSGADKTKLDSVTAGAAVASVGPGAGLINSGTATNPVLDVVADASITVTADQISIPNNIGQTRWVSALTPVPVPQQDGSFGRPFASVTAALAVAVSGDVVQLMTGTYSLAAGITIPSGVTLRGNSSNSVILQHLGAVGAIDLITMSDSSRLEDMTILLTSTGHFALRGVVFPGTSNSTARGRRLLVTVDNSTAGDVGSSNVYGIHVTGTGTPMPENSGLRACSVTVLSAGLGAKRALLVDGTGDFFAKETNFVCRRTGAAAGTYHGIECNNASAVVGIRFGYLEGNPSGAYIQTAGDLDVGGSNASNGAVGSEHWHFNDPLQSHGAFACGVTDASSNPFFASASPYLSFVVGSQTDSDYGAPGNGGLYCGARRGTAGLPPTNAPFTGLSIWDFGSGVGFDSGRILYYGGGGWSAPDVHNHQFYVAPTYTETVDTGVIALHIGSANQTCVGGSVVTGNGKLQIEGSSNSVALHQITASVQNRLVSALTIGANSAPTAGFFLDVVGAGGARLARTAATSGVPQSLLVVGPAHTGMTASTEVSSVQYNLSATKTWATGAIATQREFRIQAPTYAFAAASTITAAATLAISGAPIAGANATLTNSLALWVESGRTRLDGRLEPTQNVTFTGITTPAALAADADNYNPASLATSAVIRQDGGAADRNITGLVAQTGATWINFINIGTTNNLVLVHESGSSTAANRFSLSGAANLTIPPGGAATLFYDATTARWRAI